MKLILVDYRAALCMAWREYFADLPNVEIVTAAFESLPVFDCMVSAANSFGLMDGGVDAAIIKFFGADLQDRVQARIIDEYRGEQPVGTSMIVETDHPQHPYVAHTPTMRVPMVVARTDHAYKAMFAMLLAVEKHNREDERQIETVACPGLATGVGRMPHRQAARQMSLAYRHFLNPPKHITWKYAEARQIEIRYGGDDGFHISPELA